MPRSRLVKPQKFDVARKQKREEESLPPAAGAVSTTDGIAEAREYHR
jgi:hypothetical protein